jgi:hypothetical protein
MSARKKIPKFAGSGVELARRDWSRENWSVRTSPGDVLEAARFLCVTCAHSGFSFSLGVVTVRPSLGRSPL